MHTNLYSAKNRENESEAMDRCSCGSSGTLGAITLHPLKSARNKIYWNVSENKSTDSKLIKLYFRIHENAFNITQDALITHSFWGLIRPRLLLHAP